MGLPLARASATACAARTICFEISIDFGTWPLSVAARRRAISPATDCRALPMPLILVSVSSVSFVTISALPYPRASRPALMRRTPSCDSVPSGFVIVPRSLAVIFDMKRLRNSVFARLVTSPPRYSATSSGVNPLASAIARSVVEKPAAARSFDDMANCWRSSGVSLETLRRIKTGSFMPVRSKPFWLKY